MDVAPSTSSASPLRLRIEFNSSRSRLQQRLRDPRAAKVWMLLPPPLEYVADLAAFLEGAHLCGDGGGAGAGAGVGATKRKQPPQQLVLSIGGFVLPPDAPLSILRDNDVIKVEEKGGTDGGGGGQPKRHKADAGEESVNVHAPAVAAAPAAVAAAAPAAAVEAPRTTPDVEDGSDGAMKKKRKKKKRKKMTATTATTEGEGSAASTAQERGPAVNDVPGQSGVAPAPFSRHPGVGASSGSGLGRHVRFEEGQEEEEEKKEEEKGGKKEERAKQTEAAVTRSDSGRRMDGEEAGSSSCGGGGALAHVHPSRRAAFVQRGDGTWSNQGRHQRQRATTVFMPRCLRLPAAAESRAVAAAAEDRAGAAALGQPEDGGDSENSSRSVSTSSSSSVSEPLPVAEPRSGEYKRPYTLVAVVGQQRASAGGDHDDDGSGALAPQQYPAFPSAAQRALPVVDDVLLYRTLELSEETWTPTLSPYRVARVAAVRAATGEVELALLGGEAGGQHETLEWQALQEIRLKSGPTRDYVDGLSAPGNGSTDEGEEMVLEGAPEGGMEAAAVEKVQEGEEEEGDLETLIQRKRQSLLSLEGKGKPAAALCRRRRGARKG